MLALLEIDPAGGAPVIRAFARKVQGVARLRAGYLTRVGRQWLFVHPRLFKVKAVVVSETEPARQDEVLCWASVVFLHHGKVQDLLIPKDWAHLVPPVRRP
jgi:hypothetical protein